MLARSSGVFNGIDFNRIVIYVASLRSFPPSPSPPSIYMSLSSYLVILVGADTYLTVVCSPPPWHVAQGCLAVDQLASPVVKLPRSAKRHTEHVKVGEYRARLLPGLPAVQPLYSKVRPLRTWG